MLRLRSLSSLSLEASLLKQGSFDVFGPIAPSIFFSHFQTGHKAHNHKAHQPLPHSQAPLSSDLALAMWGPPRPNHGQYALAEPRDSSHVTLLVRQTVWAPPRARTPAAPIPATQTPAAPTPAPRARKRSEKARTKPAPVAKHRVYKYQAKRRGKPPAHKVALTRSYERVDLAPHSSCRSTAFLILLRRVVWV